MAINSTSFFSPLMSMLTPMNPNASALSMLASGMLLPGLTGDLGGANYAGIPSWGMGDVLSLVEGPMTNLASEWMALAGMSSTSMAGAASASAVAAPGAAAAATTSDATARTGADPTAATAQADATGR